MDLEITQCFGLEGSLLFIGGLGVFRRIFANTITYKCVNAIFLFKDLIKL